jgi:hypothetical protein
MLLFSVMKRRRWAAWGVAAFAAAGAAWGQEADAGLGPRLSRPGPPAAPVTSKDGSVVVYAPASKAGYRAPVLVFVDRTREELRTATRLKFGSQKCLLEISIGGKSDGDTRVLASRLRDPDGGLRERIELPDPEGADLKRFRHAVCVALLRAWMVECGGTEATMRDLPLWLIDGVVRYMDRETRQADVDRTLLLWSRACLPCAADLFAAESQAGRREPAVGAVLASWLLERRDGVNLFESLLRSAAHGTEWSPQGASILLAETPDLAAFDAYVDGRFLAESRVVVKPGLTTDGIVRRFRAHLLLYPSYFGKTFGKTTPWCTFQEAATRAADPEVRASAAGQAVRVKMAAVGRDGMLLAVSEAYVAFLEALARGAPDGELSRLLLEAEGMRRELEGRAARGGVMQRTVGG